MVRYDAGNDVLNMHGDEAMDIIWSSDGDMRNVLEQIAKWYRDERVTDCQRVEAFGEPIEAWSTVPHEIEPIGTIDIDRPSAEYIKRVVEYQKTEVRHGPNAIFGIHSTEPSNVDSIMKHGFRPEGSQPEGSGRESSVFFWPHAEHAVGSGSSMGAFVTVIADPEDVMVSSYMSFDLLQEGVIDSEEYRKHHVFPWREYVGLLNNQCLPVGKFGPSSLL